MKYYSAIPCKILTTLMLGENLFNYKMKISSLHTLETEEGK